MFSTTTIASSTTKPTAIVNAINDRLSMLNPSKYIAPQDPISASGTVTLGIRVAQKLRRNNKITSTTRAMVNPSVNSTSATEARIVVVRSRIVATSILGGIVAVSAGSRALIWSTVSTTFAPGCLKTTSSTPRLLF